MVTVKVTYKDMVNLSEWHFVPAKLHLCTFAAIDQQMLAVYIDDMRSWEPAGAG